jgi:hypothetical protein
MAVFAVNEAVATFAVPRIVAAPCGGMWRFVGEMAYVGGAPVAAPAIEFSMNGNDWDFLLAAPAGANPAAGVTLFTWDVQIVSWAFVRLTVSPPIGSVRGQARILPKIQN